MSVASDRLMNNIRVRLPGATDDAIQLEMFATLDEFFRDSSSWREEIDVSVLTTTTAYDIESNENNAVVVRLIHLLNDTIPVRATLINPTQLLLKNAPPQAGTYTATVALTVADPLSSEGLPDLPEWVFAKYRGVIEDGVLSRMMMQPAKPYSNPNLATFHGKRFRRGISSARAEVNRGNIYGSQAWVFPQTFAVSRR